MNQNNKPVVPPRLIHELKGWISIEMDDRSVAGRSAWLNRIDDWEAAGKPITVQEVIQLIGDVLTLEDIAEIKAGTSPILNGFNLDVKQ